MLGTYPNSNDSLLYHDVIDTKVVAWNRIKVVTLVSTQSKQLI